MKNVMKHPSYGYLICEYYIESNQFRKEKILDKVFPDKIFSDFFKQNFGGSKKISEE